jgi:hypothetical protein
VCSVEADNTVSRVCLCCRPIIYFDETGGYNLKFNKKEQEEEKDEK